MVAVVALSSVVHPMAISQKLSQIDPLLWNTNRKPHPRSITWNLGSTFGILAHIHVTTASWWTFSHATSVVSRLQPSQVDNTHRWTSFTAPELSGHPLLGKARLRTSVLSQWRYSCYQKHVELQFSWNMHWLLTAAVLFVVLCLFLIIC